MFKTRALGAVLVVLALSGCSAATAEPDSRVAASEEESATPTPTPVLPVEATPTAAPVEITPTEAPGLPEFNGFSSQREWFLRSLDGALSGTVPSDDELIGAGMLACEQLRAGAAYDAVRVVSGSGDTADQDNENIVWAGVSVYCPELY
jgi:hypothetical protein